MKLIAVMLVVGACGIGIGQPAEISPTPLTVPAGRYFGAAWLESGWIVVGRGLPPNADQTQPPDEIWRLKPDGSEFSRLPVPDDPACRSTEYLVPEALPDGRLGLLKVCQSHDAEAVDELSLVAYDVRTERVDALSTVGVNPNQYGWDATLARGVISNGSAFCSSVAWMSRNGVEPMDLMLKEGDRSFRLDDGFDHDRTKPCTDSGQADWPTWWPASQIAFFGSLQSIGVSGTSRLDVPWSLYLLEPTAREARKTDLEVKQPRGLGWSPDGKWLAFSGDVSGRGKGTWIYAPSSGTLKQVTSRLLPWHAWSPEGNRIFGVFDPNPAQNPPQYELLIFDVSQLTR